MRFRGTYYPLPFLVTTFFMNLSSSPSRHYSHTEDGSLGLETSTEWENIVSSPKAH